MSKGADTRKVYRHQRRKNYERGSKALILRNRVRRASQGIYTSCVVMTLVQLCCYRFKRPRAVVAGSVELDLNPQRGNREVRTTLGGGENVKETNTDNNAALLEKCAEKDQKNRSQTTSRSFPAFFVPPVDSGRGVRVTRARCIVELSME